MDFLSRYIICFLLIGLLQNVSAQVNFIPKEEHLIETQWKYKQVELPETGDVLHKGGDQYHYFVYFKFDNNYLSILNDHVYKGRWNLDGLSLNFNFNGVRQFTLIGLSEELLILEHVNPISQRKLHYIFEQVSPSASPLLQEKNLLPRILVDESDRGKEKFTWFKNFWKRIVKPYEPEPEPYVRIELTGGGYYGGINRVVKDYITINNRGTLIKEMLTEQNGNQKLVTQIDRIELIRFAEFVSRQGFFDMPMLYDCRSDFCQQRRRDKPTPVPLRISITYEDRKNIVTVPIWGRDRQNRQWIEYPNELDMIVFAIQNMAHQRI